MSVGVRHNFETAHRLPFLGGKCVNLHGHSWQVQVEVTAPDTRHGVLVDFGALKTRLREWVDTRLDHGTMLGRADQLLPVLRDAGCKVFPFGVTGELTEGLEWPTVENVAVLLARVTTNLIDDLQADGVAVTGLQVCRVAVTETATNQATWSRL